ncbi:hypothetical protein CPB86DRAFT_830651 [Serendipita vermifera]|nr:hypothetical protein CPB86DRAFT_830651 [Serendipita vermifera]
MHNASPSFKRASNKPLTNSETKRIRQFALARERDLDYHLGRLRDEGAKLQLYERDIDNMTQAVDKVDYAHSIYRQSLSLLKKLGSNFHSVKTATKEFQDIQAILGPSSQVAVDMDQINKDLVQEIQSYTSNGLEMVKNHIEDNMVGFDKLSHHLSCLQEELIGLKFTRDLIKGRISQLQSTVDDLKSSLFPARAALSPLLKVERPILVTIFRLCILKELEDYLKQMGVLSFYSVPLRLSFVCARWRNIICSEPYLWSLIPMCQDSSPSSSKVEGFEEILRRTKGCVTLLLNLSQFIPPPEKVISTYVPAPPSSSSSVKKKKGSGKVSSQTGSYTTIKLDTLYQHLARNMHSKQNYEVHMVAKDENLPLTTKATYIQLRSTNKLSFTTSSTEIGIWGVLDRFSQIEHLELYDKRLHASNFPSLTARLPSLKYLKIEFQDLPPFNTIDVFSSQLVQLRIRHNGRTRIPPLPQDLVLPELQVLGITYPESNLLHSLEAPQLVHLELYGPSHEDPEAVFDERSRQTLSRIHRLSLYDWGVKAGEMQEITSESIPVICAGDIFKRLSSFMSSLHTARFVDCKMRGSSLVDLLKFRSEAGGMVLDHLESISFEGCSVITRAEYERIIEYFPNLKFLN